MGKGKIFHPDENCVMTTLYVNPATGRDQGSGAQNAPFKTLTYGLTQAAKNTIIRLSPGTYDAQSGEKFPLIIPSGVMVIGQENQQGQGVILSGGGVYQSPTFQQQNITVLLQDQAQLRGVTVRNGREKGIGIWIESSAPTVAQNTVTQCPLAGIFITGNAKPVIRDNRLVEMPASGIFLRRNAKGEIRRNVCEKTAYGMTVSDDSAPLLADNQLRGNRVGIYLTHRVKPVLRRNLLEFNAMTGLVVREQAKPDLGHPQDPALNILRDNEQGDLSNETTQTLISVGNQLNPSRVQGRVDFVAAQVATGGMGPLAFRDLEQHWGADFIRVLAAKDWVRGFGDGTFRPEGKLTRAEFAALLAKCFDLPRQLGTRFTFPDVPESFWGAQAIGKAAAMGFLAGFGDGTFRPQANLTRIQALVALVNGLGLTGGALDGLLLYRDRAQIPSYGSQAVAIATQKRLVVNYPDLKALNPQREITRAEVAAFLHQALVVTGNTSALFSPYIVDADFYLSSFTDIEGHWAEAFIRRLAGLDWISGFPDGSFRPNAPISRAQYAALLVRVFNPQPMRPATQFLDLLPDYWGWGAIQQAYQGGFLSGFPDGTFHPEQHLRRVHLLVSLVSGLGLPGGDLSLLECYGDQGEIPSYAGSAIAAATEAGFVVNYPQVTHLNPKQEATRGEAVAMVYQALVYQGKVSPIDSEYVVRAC